MGKLIEFSKNTTASTTRQNFKKKFAFSLDEFHSNYYKGTKPVANTKCDFDIHSTGLMLRGDFSTNFQHITILAKDVVTIKLIRGKETIDTFYLSPIHILSKLGAPQHFSRHWRIHPSEYKITETKIIIEAREQKLSLTTSGYRFEKLLRSFKKMGFTNNLQIIKQPINDISEFNVAMNKSKTVF